MSKRCITECAGYIFLITFMSLKTETFEVRNMEDVVGIWSRRACVPSFIFDLCNYRKVCNVVIFQRYTHERYAMIGFLTFFVMLSDRTWCEFSKQAVHFVPRFILTTLLRLCVSALFRLYQWSSSKANIEPLDIMLILWWIFLEAFLSIFYRNST